MSKIILTISFILIQSFLGFGQTSIVSSKQLTTQEVDSLFTDRLKNEFGILFNVYRAYKYNDINGSHVILMTENPTNKTNDAWIKEATEVYHDSIKAYNFDIHNDSLILKWTLTDFIIENEFSEEYSISFWTKYFELDDYDCDDIVDPIIIYGTFGINGTSDGRIKILVYYKGKKRAIRHQNGILDFQRNTRVDKQFYTLPSEIQNRVKELMESIKKNSHGIFPYGWQDAMENNETKFDEN